MAVVARGTNFPAVLSTEIFNKVQGHSSIAKLAGTTPVSFAGTDIFTFSLDTEVAIVAESGAKGHGGAAAEPVRVTPIKIEYGARVSDEFMYASEERQLEILQAFADGFAKKVARGLDIMAFHRLNPRNSTASTVIPVGAAFDTNTDVNTVSYSSGSEEANIESAIAAIGDYDCTGIAMSKTFASALAQTDASTSRPYQALAWGANPGEINGVPVDVNSTVSVVASGGTADKAILGDFANAFKWGFAKDIAMEVIEYGDPDNTSVDLKGHNQVYLRGEAYIGWAILDGEAFTVIA